MRTSNCSRESLFTWGERSTVYTFFLQMDGQPGQGRRQRGVSEPHGVHVQRLRQSEACSGDSNAGWHVGSRGLNAARHWPETHDT